ncbi:conserved phage C-terminal domain-containing protein [Serratia marcescens]|uniref:conserved phage C-terminal domain-containing protein n=1 Tax=Serratia marcescens TaxID=615 RepID=UPI001F155549|nr:conserved phage C-terminal domain-containing protein [Serratia marcescens]WLS21648.1 conserved phage C-terminal domain-containing protein [Serratia marcescens]CAI1605058.1 Conserved phage C-terminus (Phg_2220_C) [Serratia marcescens]HCB1620412.1 conserved phage C-terminal domain-containing protein [Serratia marcescens]
MSRIFEVVQAMSGQKNCIVIPGPYLDYFAGDQQSFALAAVLNQLVFWTGKSSQDDGWFYKTHEELASELRGVSEDQVQRVVSKLRKKYLPGVIEVSTRKVNGTPKNHYRIDGDKLIALIFPPVVESAESRNGKRETTESTTQNHGMENAEVREQRRDSAESYLYTDHYTDHHKQIQNTFGQPPAAADQGDVVSEEIHITDQAILVLKHLNQLTGAKYTTAKSTLQNIRARLVDGHTLEELKLVVEYLVDRWLGTEWAKYLNPETMFRPGKFPGNLLAATAWHDGGRKPDQARSAPVACAERDAAYRRFIGNSLPLQNPGELETLARTEASKAGVRTMQPSYAVPAWNRIWTDCAQRLDGRAPA